ncbi:MAG: hypothetical protein A3F14_03435 [Gammaproteobacteria bacterium RIFCSPHIGHO2_12_FULL_43_28]|nr:MAG: hypothetical protein A3F14_03435 [Gammaproteobacteria bacterium RIFCSPHIGHO2_12_FULL_43_28]
MNKAMLMKTCSICGLQKPLSAFLQVTGPEGTNYGNICAACRKTQPEKPTENEEATSSTTGHKIDAKAKARGDIDKKQQLEKVEELYHEDRDKVSEKEAKRTEKITILTAQETKQREQQKSKQSFLDRHKAAQQTIEVFGGEQQTAKEKRIDLTAPVLDTYHGLKEKHKGVMFNQFKTWLGGGAPIGSQAPGSHTAGKEQAKKTRETTEKDPLVDYIDQNWTPGKGPKRR